jgi:hypothetical protein
MLEHGYCAEIIIGKEHLRLFSEDGPLGVQASVYNVAAKNWVSPSDQSEILKGELMTRILLLGLDAETVDFSDLALPPGMTAEKVRAGIAVALKQFH